MPLGGETVGCHMIRVLDSAGSTLVEWGRQQQHDDDDDDNNGNVDDDHSNDDDVDDDDDDDNETRNDIRHPPSHES